MKKLLAIGIVAILLLLLVPSVSATWCNNDYGKKAPILINNTGSSEQTYYQVELNFTHDSDMNANFSDIRVYNESDCSLVPLWNESAVASSYNKIWFNATNIPASSWTNDTYYLYYNYSSASSVSDGDTTFEFFDDFEPGTEKSWWTKIIDDTDYAYQGFIDNLPNSSIYFSPQWDDTAGSNTSYARPYLLDAVYVYAISGNQTYLDTAEQAADDLETYTLNTSYTVTLPIGYTYAFFNLTGVTGASTQTNYIPEGQSSEQEFYNITNTGNVNLDVKTKINATFSNTVLKYDTDNNPTGATEITTSFVTIQPGLQPTNSVDVWLWMDFNHTVAQDTNKTLEINVTGV